MIVLSRAQLRTIASAAEHAYPAECCGLLVGRADGERIVVTRVVKSRNIVLDEADPGRARDHFEVDPELHLALMRELDRGTAGEKIVGLYHSHPDHPAKPSARDLERAFETDLVWVIVAVEKGRAAETTAHRLDPEGDDRFLEIPLEIEG